VTIRKGELWGEPGLLADDGLQIRSDIDARRELEEAAQLGRPPRDLGMIAGDLARTVGASDSLSRIGTPDTMRLPVDAVQVIADGVEHWFTAHLVARRPLWQGNFVVAMNAEYLGPWRMAPASHPNDGRVDLITGRLSLGDRIKARSRLVSGTHLPHPHITVRRVKTVELDLAGALEVCLDGEAVGRPKTLALTVHPDALTVVV